MMMGVIGCVLGEFQQFSAADTLMCQYDINA